MKKPFLQKLLRIWGIITGITLVIAGICLMIACYSIYRSGDSPYSPESVAHAFSFIAIPVYLCLAAVIFGLLSNFFLPHQAAKRATEKNLPLILSRLQQKTDSQLWDAQLHKDVLALRQLRKRNQLITAGVFLICALVFLIYALFGCRFTLSDVNGSVIRCVLFLLPSTAIPFGAAVFTVYKNKATMRQEIQLLKHAPTAAAAAAPSPEVIRQNGLIIARVAIVIVAVCLLAYGFLTGGTADVLVKAINICTECVGLG